MVASTFDSITPLEKCFFVVGCFPYLGFFKIEHAQEYAQSLEASGHFTYLRPVLAYSSLGYFHDPILSPFFELGELELIELVFHELFHTIFFVKDEVAFNESLAVFFSQELMKIYFKENPLRLKRYFFHRKVDEAILKKMFKAISELKAKYERTPPKNKNEAQKTVNQYLSQFLYKDLKKMCDQHKMKNCWPINQSWNNASLAALSTYRESVPKWKEQYEHYNGDLKKYFENIEENYREYLP